MTALRRIIRAVDRHSGSLAKRFGLTGPQFLVLQEIESAGSIATGALAKRVHLAQGTASEILDRLEKTGYVERRRGETDRRRVECRLTEKGSRVIAQCPTLLQDQFADELDKLADWEQSFLLAALHRIANMMDAERLDAAPVLTTGPVGTSAEKTAEFLDEDDS